MDKLPVGQLPDLQQSNNDDEIMVITDSEHNQLKKEKISDLITDFTSTNENNALTKGTDGKMFVTDFGNASNITEGTLPTSVLPEIPLEKLPVSGVSADTYAYPSSVTVNAQGQVTAIEAGEPGANNANQDLSNISEAGKEVIRETAGSDYHLTQNQITNCILAAPNGVATFSGSTFTVKQGLKVLIPNGRNEDKTLKNIEYTVPEDKTINYTGLGNKTYDFTLLYGNTGTWSFSQNYREADTPPAFYGVAQYYLNTKENIMYFNDNNERWDPATVAVLGKGKLENGVVTSFTPYQSVELAKKQDIDGNFLPPLATNYVVNGVTIQGASSRTYDISSYFPDDDHEYMVQFAIQHNSQASAVVYLSGTGVSAGVTMQLRTQVANKACTNNGFVLIGSNRVLQVNTASLAVNNLIIGINAIRRVGV